MVTPDRNEYDNLKAMYEKLINLRQIDQGIIAKLNVKIKTITSDNINMKRKYKQYQQKMDKWVSNMSMHRN